MISSTLESNEKYYLKTKKNIHQPILDFILVKDYLDDDLEIPFRRMKDIEEATGLKGHMLRTLLLQIHNPTFGCTNNLTLSFNTVVHLLTTNYYGKNCYFIKDKLEHFPRVGKNSSLLFVKAITNINWFYVEELQHEFRTKHSCNSQGRKL